MKRRLGQSWGLGRFLFLIAFTIGFASLGIWQVRRQYDVIASGYAIDRDLFEYRRLLERQKRLNLLLSAYKDPTALRMFAEEDLGMAMPSRDQELTIPDPREVQKLVQDPALTRPADLGGPSAPPSAPAPSPSAPAPGPTPE